MKRYSQAEKDGQEARFHQLLAPRQLDAHRQELDKTKHHGDDHFIVAQRFLSLTCAGPTVFVAKDEHVAAGHEVEVS